MNIFPVTDYPYTALSANYPHDKYISYNPYFQQYDNGFYFFNHDVFNTIDDISFNKYTGFYLTDRTKNKEVIKSKSILRKENFSSSFLNLFMYSNLNYVKTDENDGYLYANQFESAKSDDFQAIVEGDKIYFIYNKISYVVVEPDSPWRVKLYTNNGIPPPVEDSYKFKFFKYNGNYIIATSYGNSYVRERYLKASVNGGFLGFIGITLADVGVQVGFNFIDYNFTPETNLVGLDEESWFYSYFNDPIDFENNLNVEPNFSKSISGIKQNFLISTAYQTNITGESKPEEFGSVFPVASFALDVFGMKNLKNPNYSYSKSPYNAEIDDNFDPFCDSDPESQFVNRVYKKIFTGTNQEFGYEEPLFLFRSNNKNITFKKDSTTYFHYPSSSPIINIESSGLIESGAFPSSIPFFADKVFKKDAQYGKHTHWGDSTQFQNGEFLCSWLSGDNDDSIWVDRWYLPSEITKFQALTSSYPENLTCGIQNADAKNKVVFDVQSILTFEPEVWYKYFHVGKDFIDYGLDEVVNYDGKYLSIHLEDFNADEVEDKSGNGNNGEFVNFDFEIKKFRELQNDTVAHLNGINEYIDINYSDEIKPIDSNTYSIWAYSDDWTTAKNGEIISNGISNYINLKISNGLETPIYCLYAKDTNQLLFLNNNNKVYKIIPLSTGSNPSNVEHICIDSNLNVWALDNSNNFLYKTNYNGIIQLKIDIPSSYSLKDLAVDSANNVYVLETNTGSISSFDSDGVFLNSATSPLTSSDFTFQLDLEDNIVGVEGHKLIIDSKNSPWTLPLDRNNLLRNTVPVLQSGACECIEDFVIDSNDNFFVLNDNNIVTKLDQVGTFSLSAEIKLPKITDDFGNITIQNDFYSKTGTEEDFVLVYKDGFTYKFDNKLNFIKRYNASVIAYETNYNSFLTDWSGYDATRKYTFLKDFNGAKNVEVNYTTFSSTEGIQEFNLPISTERLYKGWHHFAFSFDKENGLIKFYVDGQLQNQIQSLPSGTELYRAFKNSMTLGAKMGLVQSFGVETLLTNKYLFSGRLDDFRVYTKALSELEIKLLFYTKADFKDLDWHIPTGNQYYIEHVHKFFRHKMAGSKSNHYNLKILGFDSVDPEVMQKIEEVIKDTVYKVSPVYTQLNEIKWIQ
jgi:hypothetical protein